MRTEWVVLADASRARIFARVDGAGWQPIRDLTRGSGGAQANGREVRLPAGLRRMEAVVGADTGLKMDFTSRLAHELCRARKRGDFDALVLIAPAETLESVTAALDAATRRKLASTATDNLVALPLKEARRQLARRF